MLTVEERTEFEHIGFWKTVLSDGVAMGLLRISMAISLLRLKSDLKWYRYSLFAVVGTLHARLAPAVKPSPRPGAY